MAAYMVRALAVMLLFAPAVLGVDRQQQPPIMRAVYERARRRKPRVREYAPENNKTLPRVDADTLLAVKDAAREAVASGAPDAVVYWMHQRKAAGDLVVGCREEHPGDERTRACAKRWSMLANTSALAVTNEYIGVPSGCVGVPPARLDESTWLAPAERQPRAPNPAVFIGVVREPLSRWESEFNYGAMVYSLPPIVELFLPRGFDAPGSYWDRVAAPQLRALERAPPGEMLRNDPLGDVYRQVVRALGLQGKLSPRDDATPEEIAAAVAAFRSWMRNEWHRAPRCNPRRLAKSRIGNIMSECYLSNQMTRMLASNVCLCGLYEAAHHVHSVAPEKWIVFNDWEELGALKDGALTPDGVSHTSSSPDGKRHVLPPNRGPARVGQRTGCPLDYPGRDPDAPPPPVTEADFERAKEVARRFHALMPMDRVFKEPATFVSMLRGLAGFNISEDFAMAPNEHATTLTLKVLEVPGIRQALEEDNEWDIALYRYVHDELWEAGRACARKREVEGQSARC